MKIALAVEPACLATLKKFVTTVSTKSNGLFWLGRIGGVVDRVSVDGASSINDVGSSRDELIGRDVSFIWGINGAGKGEYI